MAKASKGKSARIWHC